MNRGMFVVAVFLGLGLVSAVGADDWTVPENQWYFSPMAGMNFEDSDRKTDAGAALALGLGKQIADQWALEFSLFGGRHSGTNDVAPYGVGVDLLRSLESRGTISPYLVFGTGWTRVDIVEPPTTIGESDYNNFIASAGIGLIAPLGNAASRFRGEIRYRADLHNPKFYDLLVMAGLYVPIGAAPYSGPTELPDSDGDGVPDDVDLCPATMASAEVDQYGCELDSDGDGVPNSKDRCPATPKGTEVDAMGCKLAKDSDGDGVPDHEDRCPGTPRSVKVDKNGCERDSDGDGVVDSLDSCPNTAKGVRVDVRGCEIREKIELPNVRFELESDRLIPETTAVLDQAAETLKLNPTLKVEAAGYTDTTGDASYNLDLSQRRAESVRRYLISKGANGDNITAKGYGEANPIADNSTRPGRQKNRRVDLRVLN